MLTLLGSRQSLENPTTPMNNPDTWLYDALGATTSITGLRVSRQTALTLDTVCRAIRLIATDIGKTPIHIYRRVTVAESEGKERAPDHPAFQLLRYKPNAEMHAMTFKQTLQAHALGHGNGYAYIFRDEAARPLALLPLNPDATYPVRENYRLWYVTTVQGEMRKLVPEDVLHLKGFGFDGLQGYNIFSKARESIGLGLATREYGARFFVNGAEARVVPEHPQTMSQNAQERLRKSWVEMHAGLTNAHGTAILEEGMKANVISINAQDAQLIETRKFNVREIANWFDLPPHKLGDDSKTAYNSLEMEELAYLAQTLDGWMVAWEMECRDKLLTEEEKRADSHIVEFRREALLRTDLKTRAMYYRIALAGMPWLDVNEVRSLENMNPREGWDDIRPPINMQQPGTATPADEAGNERKQVAAAAVAEPQLLKLLSSTTTRMIRRIGHQARRAAKRPDTFLDWLNGFAGENAEVLADSLGPVIELCAPADADRATRFTAGLCAAIHEALDVVYSTEPPARFAARIEAEMTRLETELAGDIIAKEEFSHA
ncbi:MAG: phage portal protein [Pseudomonadota bacterium]